MANKMRVVVCFDYENDLKYKNLLKAWDANPEFDFFFNDITPDEIRTKSVDVVKQVLSKKINEANYTLVLVGKEANHKHKDHEKIGYKNWQNYEIAKSKEHGNKLIAVKLDTNNTSPDELLNSGASWAMSFSRDSVIKAMKDAVKKAA